MRDLVTKEKALFTEEKNLGLVQLALARVPRWTLKRLTATYVTLGLAEIGKAIKIEDIEEVRALILEMVSGLAFLTRVLLNTVVDRVFRHISTDISRWDCRVLRSSSCIYQARRGRGVATRP